MEIPFPTRVLALSPTADPLHPLLKELTGTAPLPSSEASLAGTTHPSPIALHTKYYSAKIPVWIDHLPNPDPSPWKDAFLLPEAAEVLTAVGAIVFTFAKPANEAELRYVKGALGAINEVVKHHCTGGGWDGTRLLVGMPQGVAPRLEMGEEEWEAVIREITGDMGGWEYIDFEGQGKGEYDEKRGVERLREALETTEWEAQEHDLDDVLGGDSDGEDELGVGAEGDEEGLEGKGMREAILRSEKGGGEDKEGNGAEEAGKEEELKVEELEALMLKLQAARDLGADLPEQQRRKLAAKAVNDVLKSFS